MTSVTSSSGTQIGSVLQQQQVYAQRNNAGLQDRTTVTERNSQIDQMRQQVTNNHGFEARQAIKEALVHNTKIVNTPAMQRGTVVDISV